MLGVHLTSSSSVDFQRAAGDPTSPATSLPWLVESLEWVALIWYLFVVTVCSLGYFQIWRYYSSKPAKVFSLSSSDAAHVTVIRPVKGIEPYLYECLASTLRQEYPRDKLTTYICVSSRKDPSFPTLERVIADFPEADARIFIEEEDPLLQDGSGYTLGPNPKIRNMSRAYREAKGDIVWIIDCNVWVGKGVCRRMVDKLCGNGSNKGKKYKFVHHLPLAVNVDPDEAVANEARPLLMNGNATRCSNLVTEESTMASMLREGGGRLEELFLSSSHAKMYTAISAVAIAPCIVGKSNMFRRSHLNYLTTPSPDDSHPRNPGIDCVSEHLCEDHIIGDWLWKNEVREEKELGERLGKHALVLGDFAFQPVANMSVKAYIARRVRWLRVRKFTVLAATLVEPGTESIVCSLYGAIGLTTVVAELLQARGNILGSYLQTWSAFLSIWLLSIIIWATVDWTLYLKLHSSMTVEVDESTPPFTRPPTGRMGRRPFLHWFAAWIGRESLAFPIWFWAVYGGSTVVWRNRKYHVSMNDTKAREVVTSASERRSMSADSSYSNGSMSSSLSSSIHGQKRDDGKIRRD